MHLFPYLHALRAIISLLTDTQRAGDPDPDPNQLLRPFLRHPGSPPSDEGPRVRHGRQHQQRRRAGRVAHGRPVLSQ